MNAKSLSTKLIFVFLFIAVAIYFGVQGVQYFLNPQTTTLVYAYASEDSIPTTGWFVRFFFFPQKIFLFLSNS